MVYYNILLADPQGVQIGPLNDFVSFSIARSANTLGEGSIVLPDRYPIGFWRKNMRISIYRVVPGMSPRLVGRTLWFVRGWELDEEAGTWTIYLQDNLFIINRMLVAYPSETTYADKTIEEGTNDTADDLIKAYVRENGGSLSVADRQLEDFTVAPDLGDAAATEKQASYQNLLETCRGLADDSGNQDVPLFFDLVYREGQEDFYFYTQTYYLSGNRTGDGLTFSKQNGNLKNVHILWDYREEVTAVYVGGEGQGAGRLIATVTNDTVLLQDLLSRVEVFADARDSVEDTVIEAEGRRVLYKGTPRPTLTGEIIDSPLCRFGVHYDYGDQVYAEARGITFTAHVDAFSISTTGGKETIDVKLKGVTS